jgi:predicted component of type VI protein secretion system
VRNLNRRPELADDLTAAVALAPLFTEYDNLRRQGIGLQRQIEELARAHRAAETEDRTAGAAALRAGRPDPGNRAVKALEEKSTALVRRAGHVSTARGTILRDIERELGANGVEWAAEAEAHARQARLDVAAALDTYRAAWDRLASLEVSARWLRSGGGAKPVPILADVPGLKARNGEPYHLSEVFDALAAIDTEPAAPVDEPAEAEAVA